MILFARYAHSCKYNEQEENTYNIKIHFYAHLRRQIVISWLRDDAMRRGEQEVILGPRGVSDILSAIRITRQVSEHADHEVAA